MIRDNSHANNTGIHGPESQNHIPQPMPFKRSSPPDESGPKLDSPPTPQEGTRHRRASMTSTMTLQPHYQLLRRSPSASSRTDGSDEWAQYDGRSAPVRAYTNDLCDFLRDTEPPPPPSSSSLAAPSFLRKYLRKKDKTPAAANIFGSTPSLNRNASTTSLSPARLQAINKAVHNVPPRDVEPQVFANG